MAQEERVIMGLSVKAMVFFEGRLLLLQKNDAEGLHHWEFPGGGLHFTEDFEAGLRREVQEETGLTVNLEAPVGPVFKRRHLFGPGRQRRRRLVGRAPGLSLGVAGRISHLPDTRLPAAVPAADERLCLRAEL